MLFIEMLRRAITDYFFALEPRAGVFVCFFKAHWQIKLLLPALHYIFKELSAFLEESKNEIKKK